MVVNFSKVNYHERPVLVIKNAGGAPLGVLGNAYDIAAELKFNELSTLSFSVPACVDSEITPLYDEVIGMRIVDLVGIGQFILTKPKEENDGIQRVKRCTAYSLEYETSRKQITIGEGTYKFFDDIAVTDTLLGTMMAELPNWSVGYVSPSLKNKYRTFEATSSNWYDFAKNTVQQSYNCIFYFDTYQRTVNVMDVDDEPTLSPIYLSTQNLAKSIEIEEDAENIATRIDVTGADGVDIRDVNPCGTNRIINLDYFMTTSNFSQTLIDRYYKWKETVENNRSSYYAANIQYSLKVMQKATADAALVDLQGEYTALESVQATTIQAIAQNMASQSALDEANINLAAKQSEIDAKKAEIAQIEQEANSIFEDIKAIRDACSYEMFFTEDERAQLDAYIIDDAISESSFVALETSAYTDDSKSTTIGSATIAYDNSEITAIENAYGADIYDIRSGSMTVGDMISASVVSSVLEVRTDGRFVLTAFLNTIEYGGETFPSGCLTLTGTGCSATASESALTATTTSASVYFTLNASEYEKRSVAWDLYEYGESVVSKVSQPTFTFSVDSANFMAMDDFKAFRDALSLGSKIIIEIGDEYKSENGYSITGGAQTLTNPRTLTPILTGVSFNYDDPEELTLSFGDSYVSSDPEFRLVDLLNKSVSMGRQLDVKKFIYSAFESSGASTGIKDFMNSSLDVTRNAIISSSGQAISWDAAGLRLRKWANDEQTAYEDEQIWMNNNSIVMTRDGWSTAQMAIGKFHDDNLGDCWGIVAPMIVGTLIAGSSMMIESEKKDGGTAVFKVDGDGARLYNSEFSVLSGDTHITLNPDVGIVIGKYPVYTEAADGATKVLNEENARFWADTKGDIHFKGTLHGANGEFTGYIKATHDDGAYFVVNGTSMGFYTAENDPMLLYENGVMTLYGAIQAKSKDGAYFCVDGTKMGFFDSDNTPMMQYENGGLTLTGAINATSLSIITNGSSSSIEDFVDGKISGSGLAVTDDHIIATVRNSQAYQDDLSALTLTDTEIVATVRNSQAYKDDLSDKVTQAQLTITNNNVSSKITSDEAQSLINQSLTEIKLSASQISLEGYTTINSNFQIDANGTLTAKNGTFSGTFTAGNWTFNSSGATYTTSSGTGKITQNGSTVQYTTNGLHAEYGADSSHYTTLYGNYLKLVPATADCGIVVCNSATTGLGTIEYQDPTLICNGSTSESDGWSGSCGNLGTRYFRWDIGWCKTMRTQDNYSDSSRTVKHNIKELDDVGHIIDQLNPVSFVYNWNPDDKVSFGLIVEDTVDILPEICHYNATDPAESAINYVSLVPILLSEIKSLRKRVKKLERQVSATI